MHDETLDYWADSYIGLNNRYPLLRDQPFSFERFLARPAYYLNWIAVYYENTALFTRRDGSRLSLGLFLAHPQAMILVAFEQAQEELDEFKPLLKKQRLIKYFINWREALYIEQHFQRCEQKRLSCIRNGRTIEPMKNFEPTAKYKSRGGHCA